MAEWIRLCAAQDAPKSGEVTEMEAAGVTLCVANVNGTLHVLDNECPHRQGPLGQGWIEGNAVVCPWHAWAFDVTSGLCEEPEQASVRTFQVREEAGVFSVQMD